MTNSESLNKWLQIGSNLGVVIGLLFLGIQIKQDVELKQTDALNAAFDSYQARARSLIGENPASVIAKFVRNESLTDTEKVVAAAYLDTFFIEWRRSAYLERQGMFSSEWRDGWKLPDAIWGNHFALDRLQSFIETGNLQSDFATDVQLDYARLKRALEDRTALIDS